MIEKYIYAAYDFVVLTSLTHPRNFFLVVLHIGAAKDLATPLHNTFMM
jgi:hypothetical protein